MRTAETRGVTFALVAAIVAVVVLALLVGLVFLAPVMNP
jgi:hypothetical protein